MWPTVILSLAGIQWAASLRANKLCVDSCQDVVLTRHTAPESLGFTIPLEMQCISAFLQWASRLEILVHRLPIDFHTDNTWQPDTAPHEHLQPLWSP